MNMSGLCKLKADTLKGPFPNKAKTIFPTISSYQNIRSFKVQQIPVGLKCKIIKSTLYSFTALLLHMQDSQ